MKITIYTDGSSRGNPGPGGWAAILITEPHSAEASRGAYHQVDDHRYENLGEVIELGGREDMTTNNRMELMGAIEGLKHVNGQWLMVNGNTNSKVDNLHATRYSLHAVEVCTDSEYVKKGMTEWIDGWIKKGWKTSTKKPVLNQDLWEALKHEEDRLKQEGVHVTWKYVPAHVGIALNERADTIATACADDAKDLQLYRGPKSEYTL